MSEHRVSERDLRLDLFRGLANMRRKVITVTADTSLLDAGNLMLQRQISGLPVVDATERRGW
jgi:CBS domain-containing protein